MMDSANIQAHDAAYLRKEAKKRGEKFDWEPLFDEKDVIQVAGLMVGVSYNRPMPIGDGVELEFYDAGHILGSAMAYITVKKGGNTTRILCSGDLGRKGMPIIRDPDRVPPPDYIVLESTYGDRRHDAIQDAMKKLGDIARDCVKRKGRIIIPAFAIERTQELVYYFHLWLTTGSFRKFRFMWTPPWQPTPPPSTRCIPNVTARMSTRRLSSTTKIPSVLTAFTLPPALMSPRP
jgi:metallo-beta-lactamase family protein